MSTFAAKRSLIRVCALDAAALALGLATGAWIGVAYERNAAPAAEAERPAIERPVERTPAAESPAAGLLRIV